MQALSGMGLSIFAFSDRAQGDWCVHPDHTSTSHHKIQTDLVELDRRKVVVTASLSHINGDGEAQYGVVVEDVTVEDGQGGKVIVVHFKAFTDGNNVHILAITFSGIAFGS